MGMWVGRGRKARVAYGFDDIALVPGTVTINPNEVDISWELCGHRFELPIIAAAMDGVVGPRLATEMGRLDRKSTRLNSSHSQISYAVFCLQKKKKTIHAQQS